MIIIHNYRKCQRPPSVRTNSDCDWQERGDDGDNELDIVPQGSRELSSWEMQVAEMIY